MFLDGLDSLLNVLVVSALGVEESLGVSDVNAFALGVHAVHRFCNLGARLGQRFALLEGSPVDHEVAQRALADSSLPDDHIVERIRRGVGTRELSRRVRREAYIDHRRSHVCLEHGRG